MVGVRTVLDAYSVVANLAIQPAPVPPFQLRWRVWSIDECCKATCGTAYEDHGSVSVFFIDCARFSDSKSDCLQ
jgi:hypothetical protein